MTGDQFGRGLFPKEMTTGLDLKEFGENYRTSPGLSVPRNGDHRPRVGPRRVEQSLIAGGLIKSGASMSGLHDTTIVGG